MAKCPRISPTASSKRERLGRKRWFDLELIPNEIRRAIEGAGWKVTAVSPLTTSLRKMADDDEDVLLVFDGGSLGNPGLGYGSFLFDGLVRQGPVAFEFPGTTTNNEAEYQSLIAGLRVLLDRLQNENKRPGDIVLGVRSDSQLLVNQVTGQWKVKKPHLRALHQEVQSLSNQFQRVRVKWHPRVESVTHLGH